MLGRIRRRYSTPLIVDPLGDVGIDRMKRRLVKLSIMAALVLLAEGVAMVLPGPASRAGGVALVIGGVAWLALTAPRLVAPGRFRASPVLVIFSPSRARRQRSIYTNFCREKPATTRVRVASGVADGLWGKLPQEKSLIFRPVRYAGSRRPLRGA
jgi:hypothetical protein